MSLTWLPQLVLFSDSCGDWKQYEERLYAWFSRDFLDSLPHWPGKRVALKRHPVIDGKEATFWHFVSKGKVESERLPDMRRCERIGWPRPTIESFTGAVPVPEDRILWWRNQRRTESRYILALPDFSYLVVVADRGDYVLPWTHYPVEREHQREKYRKEFRDFWEGQKD